MIINKNPIYISAAIVTAFICLDLLALFSVKASVDIIISHVVAFTFLWGLFITIYCSLNYEQMSGLQKQLYMDSGAVRTKFKGFTGWSGCGSLYKIKFSDGSWCEIECDPYHRLVAEYKIVRGSCNMNEFISDKGTRFAAILAGSSYHKYGGVK